MWYRIVVCYLVCSRVRVCVHVCDVCDHAVCVLYSSMRMCSSYLTHSNMQQSSHPFEYAVTLRCRLPGHTTDSTHAKAAQHGSHGVVSFLLAAGADPGARDDKCQTPIQVIAAAHEFCQSVFSAGWMLCSSRWTRCDHKRLSICSNAEGRIRHWKLDKQT